MSMPVRVTLGVLFFIGANLGIVLVFMGQDMPTKALGLFFEILNGVFLFLTVKGGKL